MTDLKTLLDENNQNIKDYIDNKNNLLNLRLDFNDTEESQQIKLINQAWENENLNKYFSEQNKAVIVNNIGMMDKQFCLSVNILNETKLKEVFPKDTIIYIDNNNYKFKTDGFLHVDYSNSSFVGLTSEDGLNIDDYINKPITFTNIYKRHYEKDYQVATITNAAINFTNISTTKSPQNDNDIVNKKYVDNMKDSILGEGISETFDTLKEIQDWMEGEGVNATELTEAIAAETERAQSVENEIKEKYLPKSSNSNKEAYIEYANNGLELDMGGKSGISLTTGDSIDLTTNYGVIITSDVSNGGLTVNLSGGRVGNAADPIENTDLTTKQYVDKIENKIPTTTSDLTNNSDFQTSAQVAEAIANADISADLTDYVTNSELASTLSEYAKIENITGDVPFSHDWKDITSKPEYFDTNWELIDNKPTNLATTDQINSLKDEISDKISKTTDILEEIDAETENTIGWNFQNTYISNINSISGSGATISYYQDTYPTIKLEATNSSIAITKGLSLTGDERLFLCTKSNNAPDSLSITSANSILLNVGSTDDSYIKANGNIKLPSNYSILDENGNDRLVNQSSINTLIDDNGLIFKSDETDSVSDGFSLTKNSTNSEMLDFYFSGMSGQLNCSGGLFLGGNSGITLSSGGEISIQVANSSLIISDNEVKLSAHTSIPIYLNTVSGVKTYNQIEIIKSRPDDTTGHSSIILYDDNDNEYEIYVDTSGKLSCNKITT